MSSVKQLIQETEVSATLRHFQSIQSQVPIVILFYTSQCRALLWGVTLLNTVESAAVRPCLCWSDLCVYSEVLCFQVTLALMGLLCVISV